MLYELEGKKDVCVGLLEVKQGSVSSPDIKTKQK